MSKMLCPCGEVISMSGPIPNPIEWLLISSVDYDRFQGTIDAERLYKSMISMFKCPKSGHLFIFWNGMGESATVYAPSGTVD